MPLFSPCLFIIYSMLSENEENEQGYSQSSAEEGVTAVFGMYFCNKCKNMLTPYKANGQNLQFSCHFCEHRFIDFSRREGKDCMLYTKELQVGSKKYVPDLSYIFDPTMPNVQVECPECGYNRAVYFLTPDEGESKIVAKMICASSTGNTPKCGHIWDLDENCDLLRTRVVTEDEKLFEALKK